MKTSSSGQTAFTLSDTQIVKAWQSERVQQSLTKKQREALPANPAGELEFEKASRPAEFAVTLVADCGPQHSMTSSTCNSCGSSQCISCDYTCRSEAAPGYKL